MHTLLRFLLPVAAINSVCALPEGFVIRQFAGPPEVDYVTSVSAAGNGDLYVSSDQDGSLGHAPHMGRVFRCRDKDGDGKADEIIKFIPDVSSPRGLHFVGDTLYLIHPPFLTAYRDTNGDGVADEEKLLVKNLGGGIEHPRGADHTTNSVRMGIDGWLYIAVGDFGAWPATGTDGSTCLLNGGGVLRVRPDGTQVETYSTMCRNIVDIAISPTLDLFSRDNTNDGKGWNTRFLHHTALNNHGYPRLYQNFADEATQPLADYGGGSGTGALWLSEPGFPQEFTDCLFSCDWTTGNIYYHPWKRTGASFAIEQKVFEKLPRAIDIDVDGNSRLYLADWRGGSFNFAGAGKPVSMIQQVIFPGAPPAKYTDVAKATDPELVKLLASASAVQRLQTQREILRRGKKPLFNDGITAIAKDPKQNVAIRTAAIFTYKQLYGIESTKFLATLCTDDAVHELALRAMTDLRSELDGVPVKLYVDALKDKNARVALQAIVGLERLKAKEQSDAILSASIDWREEGDSPRLQHTAMQALVSLGNAPVLLQAVANPKTRKLALLVLERMPQMDVVNGLLAIFSKNSDLDARYDILAALARLSHIEKPWDLKSWWSTRPDDRGPYFDPIAWEGTATIIPAIEKGFGMIAPARQNNMLDVLGKNRIAIADLKLGGVDPVIGALSAKEISNTQLMLLVDAAKDNKRPIAQRIEAYKALSKAEEKASMPYRLATLAMWSQDKKPPAELADLMSEFVNDPLRGNEIPALREIAAKQGNAASRIAWKAMLTVLKSPLAKPNAKNRVQQELDKKPHETGLFLAIADLKLPGLEAQIEAGLHWDNTEVINAANAAKAAVASATPAAGNAKHIAELPLPDVAKAAMTGKGDVAIGARLFVAQGCVTCHSIDLQATQKGPYLGAAGAKFTRDYLIDSVLEPSKVVAQGFQTVVFTLKDKSSKMGFVTNEADGVIEMRDIAGQVSQIKRADVSEETHLPTSMMPQGLAAGLSVEDFTSLIDYLSSLKSKGG